MEEVLNRRQDLYQSDDKRSLIPRILKPHINCDHSVKPATGYSEIMRNSHKGVDIHDERYGEDMLCNGVDVHKERCRDDMLYNGVDFDEERYGEDMLYNEVAHCSLCSRGERCDGLSSYNMDTTIHECLTCGTHIHDNRTCHLRYVTCSEDFSQRGARIHPAENEQPTLTLLPKQYITFFTDNKSDTVKDFAAPLYISLLRTIQILQQYLSKLNVIHIFLLLLTCSTVSAQSWSVPPEDVSQHVNNDVILYCGLQNLNGQGIVWIQLHHNGTLIENLFFDDTKWTDNARYAVQAHSSTPGVSGYDLTITGLQQFDDKMYRCEVQGYESRDATVTVLVAPDQPVITITNVNDLEEGDNATLTCSSTNGNPRPTFTWYIDDAIMTGSVPLPSEKFGTAKSVIYRVLSREDDGARIRCEVINEAVPSPRSEEETLSVKYAPVLDFGPYNPLVVVETSAVTLTCNIDANPAPTLVQWSKNGQVLGNGVEYSLGAVYKEDAGTYRCTARNTVATTAADLVLQVHYGPSVSVQYSNGHIDNGALRIDESERLNLTCDVDANPPVNMAAVTWSKDGAFVKTGPWVYISQVDRSDSGTYRCEAENTLQPSEGAEQPETGSGQLTVHVQYGPGSATIAVPEKAVKGEIVTLTCTIDDPGFPEATLVWTRSGSMTRIGTGEELTFNPIRLEHTGEYICTPENTVADGTADVAYLQVLEYTEWINGGLPNGDIEHTIEDRGISLACSARGNPAPTVTWYKDEQRIDNDPGYFRAEVETQPIEVHSFNVTSVLYWQGSSRSPHVDSLLASDSGVYKCSARNDIDSSELEDTVALSVYYPPVLNTTTDKVAIDMSQDAILSCRAHSLPSTVFAWHNGSVQLSTDGRIDITSSYTPGSEYPYESILTISQIEQWDFGVYTCIGSNNQGSSEIDIELTVKTVPESPSYLETLDITWESVELQWQPGFDGGYPQDFTISYLSTGTSVEEIPVGSVSRYNVSHLYPELNYTFRVIASNHLGTGDPSNMVAAETDDFEIEPLESGEVTYDENTHTVTFDSTSSTYCARIDIHDGDEWFNYLPCAPTDSGSIKIDSNQNVDRMRVALCLETRPDICSDPTMAVIVEQEEDLPTYVVIIIGVICAAIVIALTIVLVILCYKRRQSIKKYEEQNSKPPNAAAAPPPNQLSQTQPVAPPNGEAKQLKSALKAYDNPNLDQHSPTYDARQSPVFTTQTSQGPDNFDYYQKQQNGNGLVPNGGPNYSYENQNNIHRERSFKSTNANRDSADGNSFPMNPASRNNSSAEKPYLYLEDPYRHPSPHHNNSGEGSMGSDQNKPKKVMYEVVV